MQVQVLGPVRAVNDGVAVAMSGQKRKALLAILATQRREIVAADQLVEHLWGGRPPTNAVNTLQSHVSYLRRLLGSGPALAWVAPGYVLQCEPDDLDLDLFDRHVRAARATADARQRLGHLDRALDLWRGLPFADVGAVAYLENHATGLAEARLGVVEERVDARLALGQHRELIGELDGLVREHPFREALWEQLMLALYRSGRQADALHAYQRARAALVDELGVEPGRSLQDLEAAILAHDTDLELTPPMAGAAQSPVSTPPAPTTARPAAGTAHLPVPVTSFVGRAHEVDQLVQILGGSRVVSLVGPGGCGKTRLALEAARRLAPTYAGGAAFADIGTVTDPRLIPGLIATALGLAEHRGAQLELVCERLAREELLLVIDNCEHLLDACADVITAILEQCPGVKIVTTTRETLDVEGEQVYPVPSLSLPASRPALDGRPAASTGDARAVLQSEAVQLFLERAAAVRSSFELDDTSLRAVAAICEHLDGIPLALELAAPLAAMVTAPEIARRMDDRFALLGQGRRRGSVPRQTTLRAAVDWSFRLLDAGEGELFQRLSVFAGTFSIDAVEAIVDDDDRAGCAATLLGLIKKSMVVMLYDRRVDDAPRYRLLETLRAYGLERLAASGRELEVRRRHAAHYLEVAETADVSVHGPNARQSLDLVERELANLSSALVWSFSTGDHEYSLRLAGALHWFFGRMGNLDRLCRWLDEALDLGSALSPPLRLLAVSARNTLAFSVGDYTRSSQLGEEAIALAVQLDDRRQLLSALVVRGGVAVYSGESARAKECLGEAMELCRELGDRWAQAWALTGSGIESRRAGHTDVAQEQFQQALGIFVELENDHGQVLPLLNLAMLAQSRADYPLAEARCREAIAAAHRLGDRQFLHACTCTLGRILLDRGEVELGCAQLIASLAGFRGAEHWLTVAIALEGLAIASARRHQYETGAMLLGAADVIRSRYHIPLTADRSRERDALIVVIDHHLGAARREQAGRIGAGFSVDEAVARASAAIAVPVAVNAEHRSA